ncbi:MAG: DNA primase, partial [Pseudomonadota bacterium]
MTITPQWKDELRARITLSTVVMRTTKLTRAGREWKACCPFHDENTPSFYVNDQKGFYHCFGCGAHGDVISWMTEQRGLSFIDACKELASEAGMEVPAPDPIAAKKAEKRAELVDVTTAAQEWFVDNLRGPEGRVALEYLKRRGLKPETLREFGFGYAPESKQALAKALQRFDPAMLVDSGMRIRTDDGTEYDRFRGRVMLPIQDARGRVIAFGGRILEKRDGVAKYLNSPDTPLFDKGRTLYNLHRAAPASRQSGRVVVVEGYMDVVALAQAGIADAVAPLGTALTEAQLEMLWRMVEVPVLCFDGDAAGQRAAMRAISRALPLLTPDRNLQIALLPSGLDPDDLIKKHGVAAMEDILSSPLSAFEFLFVFERARERIETIEQAEDLKNRLDATLKQVTHEGLNRQFRSLIGRRCSQITWALKQRDFDRNKRKSAKDWRDDAQTKENTPILKRVVNLRGGIAHLFDAVMAGLVRHPDQIARHAEALTRLAQHDQHVAPTIESLIELAETLDSQGPDAIFGEQGYPAPPEDHRYAFLREGTPTGEAREELAEAVSLLVEKPALEAAMAATIARFDDDP